MHILFRKVTKYWKHNNCGLSLTEITAVAETCLSTTASAVLYATLCDVQIEASSGGSVSHIVNRKSKGSQEGQNVSDHC